MNFGMGAMRKAIRYCHSSILPLSLSLSFYPPTFLFPLVLFWHVPLVPFPLFCPPIFPFSSRSFHTRLFSSCPPTLLLPLVLSVHAYFPCSTVLTCSVSFFLPALPFSLVLCFLAPFPLVLCIHISFPLALSSRVSFPPCCSPTLTFPLLLSSHVPFSPRSVLP